MDCDRETALIVNRIEGRRGRHTGPNPALEKQTDDVPVAAGHLFTDDDVKPRSLRGVLLCAQGAFDRVWTRARDAVDPGSPGSVVDELFRCRPAVAGGSVHVEVGPTRSNHGCASYGWRPYHQPFQDLFIGLL